MSKLISLILVGCFLTACNSDDDSSNQGQCDDNVTLSSNLYTNGQSDIFSINSVEIVGNCLVVNYSASGCDGTTWSLDLVDSEAIMESAPPQRNLRLIFINNEACLAFLTAELSFDITDLQIENENSIVLNILNINESLSYDY